MLAVLSVALDGAGLTQLGPGGVFGWLQRDYLLRGTYLSVGPGLFGHVGFNVRLSFLQKRPVVAWVVFCAACSCGP